MGWVMADMVTVVMEATTGGVTLATALAIMVGTTRPIMHTHPW